MTEAFADEKELIEYKHIGNISKSFNKNIDTPKFVRKPFLLPEINY